MQHQASFLFYGSLNDFLAPADREKWITYLFRGNPGVKDAIEALGVPHPEVGGILINQLPATLKTQLQHQNQVRVYPSGNTSGADINLSFTNTYQASDKFILDVHLGKLAKSLRMLGFDAAYQNDYTDAAIAKAAAAENRIVLTRDVGLLKQTAIQRGYWLRSQQPEEQLREVIKYYGLLPFLKPLTRCLVCNGSIVVVAKEAVLDQLPPKTRLYFQEFYQCLTCRKVYWKGSHYDHMQTFLDSYNTASR